MSRANAIFNLNAPRIESRGRRRRRDFSNCWKSHVDFKLLRWCSISPIGSERIDHFIVHVTRPGWTRLLLDPEPGIAFACDAHGAFPPVDRKRHMQFVARVHDVAGLM